MDHIASRALVGDCLIRETRVVAAYSQKSCWMAETEEDYQLGIPRRTQFQRHLQVMFRIANNIYHVMNIRLSRNYRCKILISCI
jgi:hypothetical protein